MRTWQHFAFYPLLALGGLITLYPAADPPANLSWSRAPFTDEGLKTYNARNYVLSGRWTFDDNDTYPGWHLRSPLFTGLVVTSFKIGGVGLVQARAVGMLFGLLLPPAVALLLWRNGRRGEAGIAWLLLVGSFLYIMYARLCLFDIALAVFLTLSLCGLTWGGGYQNSAANPRPKRPKRRAVVQIVLAMLAFIYAFLTKPVVLVMLPTILVGLGVFLKHRGISRKRMMLPVGVVIAAMLVFGAYSMMRWKGAGGYIAGRLTLDSLRGIATSAAGLVVDIDGGGTLRGLAEFWRQTVMLAALALCGLVMTLWNWRKSDALLKLSVVWIINYCLFLAPINYKPNRYFLPMLPPLAILAASFVVAMWRRSQQSQGRLRVVAAGGVVAVMMLYVGVGAWQYSHWASNRRYDLVQSSRAIQAMANGKLAVMEGTWATPLSLETSLRCYPNGEGANSTPAHFERYRPDYAIIEREGRPPAALVAAYLEKHADKLADVQEVRSFRLGRFEIVMLKLDWKKGATGVSLRR